MPCCRWTGKPPVHGVCPGVDANGKITSLPLPDCEKGSRQSLLDYFDNTWTLTEVLFSGLMGRDVFLRSPWHQLRHPLIFYYGHVACLYINKFRVAGLLKEGVNEYMEQIMETGVDEMSWDDLSKNEMEWPDLREVTEYRRTVYNIVKDVILNGDWSFPIKIDDPAWAIVMGFEHERIHLETSSVLIRELPAYLVTRPAQFPDYHPSATDGSSSKLVTNEMVHFSGGEVELGKPRDFPSFGWDNEYGTRKLQVNPFSVSKFLITNGEFLEFVRAGGYANRNYWTEAGWQWRVFRNVHFPTFWVPNGPVGLHQYKLRVIFDIVDLPLSWPVDVNAHEARAYCAWKTAQDKPESPYRLITEGEHNIIRDAAIKDTSRGTARDFVMMYAGNEIAAKGDNKYNSNLAWGSQSPVDALAPSSSGIYDVFGNVWHWCEDDFNPLDDFKISPLYVDFSTPCYDGLHTIILGGSFISTGDEASIWSRFHFRPHFNQHAGFRLACGPNEGKMLPKLGTNGASVSSSSLTAEIEKQVNEHMLFHYGAKQDVLPWEQGPSSALSFPLRIARLVQDWAAKLSVANKRVLDLGCSVGGASFELAKKFSDVVGVDVEHFVQAAEEMKRDGQRKFSRKEEGKLATELIASTDSFVDRTRVTFRTADLENLCSADLGRFNVVLLEHILERVSSPSACLSNMVGDEGLVERGGLLVVATSSDWSEDVALPQEWLGGTVDAEGNEISLTTALEACFKQGEMELQHREDMPMLIRESARSYKWRVINVSVWRRK
ncbi:hypothetical protein GUITHDRAFT_65798 [Guillardia theta CCMP2712]|uniref:Sulfatase-modifying factor enzyme-like domain-containing protein n=1 Tax=Guillardia theta (strain CCMP2712) TaxID=905079 RepID=L1JTT0_GUITC|nr:hypothetical protein GUITHDRAFT_65798 [Guillardia theta CCMP2712]EKX51807.1 hypothetical protein GUITHDRAFT_65798 [Guillardia theta CCMP2712]|eukprot:XP_005838787.1 hypothetical protein GUITHDRAFT_65798 [Guillardia theta CCMP2712]